MQDFNYYVNFFRDYTSKFSTSGERKNKIELKIKHTFKTIEACEKIAKRMNRDNEDIFLAKILGLFHDIGRMYQIYEYNSFDDRLTMDHAEQSVTILEDSGILSTFDAKTALIIKRAIFHHNKPTEEVPNFDIETDYYIKLIRDADKIDIFRVVLEKEFYNNCGLDYNKISLDAVMNKKLVPRTFVFTKLDNLLMMIGWIYDINFKISKRIIVENGDYKILLELLPNTTEFIELKEQIKKELYN